MKHLLCFLLLTGCVHVPPPPIITPAQQDSITQRDTSINRLQIEIKRNKQLLDSIRVEMKGLSK